MARSVTKRPADDNFTRYRSMRDFQKTREPSVHFRHHVGDGELDLVGEEVACSVLGRKTVLVTQKEQNVRDLRDDEIVSHMARERTDDPIRIDGLG